MTDAEKVTFLLSVLEEIESFTSGRHPLMAGFAHNPISNKERAEALAAIESQIRCARRILDGTT